MKKIVIIGAGGFGREVKMLIDDINKINPTYQILGFYDDRAFEGELNGLPYLGRVSDINNTIEELHVAISIADPIIKKKIVESISNPNIHFPNLIHPTALIGNDFVNLGKGNIVCAGVIITVNIEIKDFVILNLACTVGHDTTIQSYSSFMPTVNISGEVIIKEGVYVGTGAKIINQLEIGEYSIVGAGAVVAKTLPSFCTAVGIPAKPIKFHNQENK